MKPIQPIHLKNFLNYSSFMDVVYRILFGNVGLDNLDPEVTSLLGGGSPNNAPAQAHKFLKSYNAGTKNFGFAQPDYSDLTGTPPPVGGAAGGDLTGTYPNPTVAKIAGTAITGTTGSGNVVLDTNPVITGNAAIANAEVGALVVDTSLSFGAVPGIGVYASNAAAIAAGLPVGRVYRNGDNLCIVH